jgi:hypothetical protein
MKRASIELAICLATLLWTPGPPAVLCNELNSGFFQSLLQCVDGCARYVAAGFFKIDNR